MTIRFKQVKNVNGGTSLKRVYTSYHVLVSIDGIVQPMQIFTKLEDAKVYMFDASMPSMVNETEAVTITTIPSAFPNVLARWEIKDGLEVRRITLYGED